jgi:hypothetical protein
MSIKATHFGECQVCGHVQKLPGDRLSLHGYTKRWGFFSGTCNGSRALPFEISCDLVRTSIEQQRTAAAHLRKLAEDLRTKQVGEDERVAWVQVSVYIGRRAWIQSWEEIEIAEDARTYDGITYRSYTYQRDTEYRKGYTHTLFDIGKGVKSYADAIRRQNKARAAAFESDAKQIDTYLVWQEERLAGWKPRELKAVE